MQYLASLISCLTLAALLAGCSEKQAQAPPPPPPPTVKAATVLERDVPVYIEAIGETRGNTEIEIRARVEGFIESVDFKEGSMVEKGQPLYTIDRRPFDAALAQANATVAEAEAQLARTHQDVARYEPLVQKNAISREEYETAVALEKAAGATVEATQAMRDKAMIDLSYTKVTSPEAGLVGKTEVYAGTLVGRGQSTLLTRISRTDPIHVRVTVSEREYLELARKKTASTQAKPEAEFQLVLADGAVHPSPGKLVFVDRTVDARTGTILIEIAFPNPDHIVRPGQYARVRATVDVRPGAILVPQGAVQELQGVYSVMVVSADNAVEQRLVKPGRRVESLWVMDSGLKSGERIVVEGLQKVRPGAKVEVQSVLIGEEKEAAEQSAEHKSPEHESEEHDSKPAQPTQPEAPKPHQGGAK